jgi:hypothetical protein
MKKKLLEQKEKAIIESFAKNYNTIKRLDEQPIDEINLKTLVPAATMAVASMLPAKKAAAQDQMQQQQGIEKSVSDTSTAAIPQDALKLGKVIYQSFIKDPFTADMWSKQSRENLRFFKTVKKLYDYASNGGQIEYSDLEQLGEMAQESSVTANFLQRKKEDFNTARLEEEDVEMQSEDKMISSKDILTYLDLLEKNVDDRISKYSSEDNKNTFQFIVNTFEGYKASIEIIRNQIIKMTGE